MQRFLQQFFFLFKEYIVLVVLLLTSLSIISLNDSPRIKSLRTLSIAGFSFTSSVIDFTISIFRPDAELIAQKKLNAELMLELNLLREAERENNTLGKMLAFKDSVDFPLTAARIISKTVNATQGGYIINVGENDSIKVGMPVITESGLAGIVNLTTTEFSYIRTLENSLMKVAVENTRSKVSGVLGWNGKDVVIKNIPSSYDIEPGDKIITSEFSTIFPPSIPVGYVTRIEETTSGLLTNVYVEPNVDYVKLKNVFVVKLIPDKQIDSLNLNLLHR
ncbi:MAG: hypothetical protein SCALA702_18260 [Melioribacteraceae bacterium]|nr:MAG: hypothetical protein SCALA702_18260 [Melioribacteraceae bacterium]